MHVPANENLRNCIEHLAMQKGLVQGNEKPEQRLPLLMPKSDIPSPTFTAFIQDKCASRAELISKLIGEKGGSLTEICSESSSSHSKIKKADIFLMEVDHNSIATSSILQAINSLKQSGTFVIAYGDGAADWPVRVKCGALMAGVSKLLNSSDNYFLTELSEVLRKAIQAASAALSEDLILQRIMSETGVTGESSALKNVFQLAVRFSQFSDLPVLITGETGTGKELLAKAIYKLDSKRNHNPYLVVNCAAIPGNLLDSEFFGHRRGAFTGADRDRKGLVRAAEGGVLLLDEIGELELSLQAKLLRTLQERTIRPLGDDREVQVSVRFIAATNRDLEQMVAQGKFREDLYYRLKTLIIHAPPLRDRLEDIPALVHHFIQKQRGSGGSTVSKAGPDFIEALKHTQLPGNVRQLENLIYRSLANHQGDGELELADIPMEVMAQLMSQKIPEEVCEAKDLRSNAIPEQERPFPNKNNLNELMDNSGWNLPKAVHEFKQQVFNLALERSKGNQSKAARLLGVTTRTLYNKARKRQLSN